MFEKVLVANRGEIAIRVFRTLRELGIDAVGVYSEGDRDALHVAYADEAFLLGPTPAAESYLAVDRILDAAQRAGAQAVHPGYGFLAENAAFAQAVEDAGLVWIGPPPAAIELMGSKTAARTAMQEAGVPIIPGTTDPVGSVDELLALGDEIGFPLLIKAAAGGGGKGMEEVHDPAQAEQAFERDRRRRGPGLRLPLRGDDRGPAHARRRLLLHGDEHAHPGRAHGHRDGHGARSCPRADPRRARRAAVGAAGGRRATRPRDRVPDQRGGRGTRVPPRACRGDGLPRAGGTGRAGRFGRRGRLRGLWLLRPDGGEAHRARRRPRARAAADASRARRVLDRGADDADRLPQGAPRASLLRRRRDVPRRRRVRGPRGS